MRRETNVEEVKPFTKPMGALSQPDSIRTPFGDLMNDDVALEQFRGTMKDMYGVGIISRRCYKKGKMSRKRFKEFMSHLQDMDDDKPLKAYL